MSPPAYSDLGKKAKDVFGKGYHFGLIKLDCKTKTGSGVEFNTGGTSNQESGKVFGSLETKYRVKDYGLTFSEKWNTDNTLSTEVAVQDQLLKGLKISGDLLFSPQTGYLLKKKQLNFNGFLHFLFCWFSSKSARVKSSYVNERIALNSDIDLDTSGPIINAAAVVGHQGWLAGYQTAFDTQKSKLTKSNFAVGFSTGDFILHTNV